MTVKKWVALLALAGSVGSGLSLVWTGDWRWLWTALILFAITLVAYILAVADEQRLAE